MPIDAATRASLAEGTFEEGLPSFEELRLQVPFPCKAKCAWCSTWKKNPRFLDLYDSGVSDQVMNFYAKVIKDERPRRLMLSGGEPILYPQITSFLEHVAPYVETIYLYTSYQYEPEDVAHVRPERLPGDKLVFTHSVIDFLPDEWHKKTVHLTPHDKYVENLRIAKGWPGRKIVKFVLNHPHLADEVDLFRKMVEPDALFHLEAKILNNQSNNYGRKRMEATRKLIHENRKILGVSTNNELQLDNIIKDRIVENCIHWRLPELRFALYREQPEIVLKYRFCGYFSPDFGYKLHINEYKRGMFHRAFMKGRFKEACSKCRLLYYRNPIEDGVIAED